MAYQGITVGKKFAEPGIGWNEERCAVIAFMEIKRLTETEGQCRAPRSEGVLILGLFSLSLHV